MYLQSKKWWWSFTLAGSVLGSTSVFAGGFFKTLPDMIEREWKSHEIAAASLLTKDHFGLTSIDRYEIIRKHLHARGLHPLLRLVSKPSDYEQKPVGKFSTDLGLVVREYGVRAGEIEICKSTIRTVDGPHGSTHILGIMPAVDAVYPVAMDSWPSPEESALKVMQVVDLETDGELTLTSMSRCLYPLAGELVPAWKVRVRAGHVPYVVYASADDVIEGYSLAFDATAKVRAYHSNSRHPDPKNRALVEFTVDVNGDGYLSNGYFTTGFGDAMARKTAPFDADESSSRHFDEQSTFAHVNRQFQFVSQYGYVWKGPKPIQVITSSTTATRGNALYVAADDGEGPFILIGGDYPGRLTNLAKDSDVVSHEFGHHVVYSSVSVIPRNSESVVVHEGLADALTFYASGDNCLAESICPTGKDTSCFVANKCLRTGESNMKYQDDLYNANADAPHIRGQVISGLFADLKRSGAIPQDNLNKLLIATVSFLPSEANMKSLVVGLLDADYALFGGKDSPYATILKNAAAARGLGVENLGIDLAQVDGQRPPDPESDKKSKDRGIFGVCSIGGEQQNLLSGVSVLILLLLPVFLSVLRRPRPKVVRIRNKIK